MASTRINPRALAELFELLVRGVYSQAFVAGLNPTQWWVLRYLARADDRGRLPSALAEAYLAGRSTVSQTIASLVAKGLVLKERDRTDGRARYLRLTVAGTLMLKRDPMERLIEAVGALTVREQNELAESVEKLVRQLFATQGHTAVRERMKTPASKRRRDRSTIRNGKERFHPV